LHDSSLHHYNSFNNNSILTFPKKPNEQKQPATPINHLSPTQPPTIRYLAGLARGIRVQVDGYAVHQGLGSWRPGKIPQILSGVEYGSEESLFRDLQDQYEEENCSF
jgi:hypothetical protein